MEGKRTNVFCISAIYLILFLLLCIRLFLSVELTDETYYVASTYNIYLGQKPFITSWDPRGGYCFLVPLFAIFQLFSPNYEGIILFFRVIYLIFVMGCAGWISWLFYKRNGDMAIILFIFPMICFVPFSLFQVSYNSVLSFLLAVIAAMLVTSEEKQSEPFRYFGIGILMSIACITYPTLVITAILLTVWIGFCNRHGRWKTKVICYVIGGILSAVLFLVWIFMDGSLQLFWKAIHGILYSPHEITKGPLDETFLIQTFYVPIKAFFLSRLGYIAVFYLLLQTVLGLFRRDKRQLWSKWIFMIFLLVNGWFNRGILRHGILGIGIALMGLYLSERHLHKKYVSLYVLFIACVLTYCFTSDNRNVLMALDMAAPFLCFIAGMEVWETFAYKKFYLAVACMVLLAATGIVQVYSYVYRDAVVEQLNNKVEFGIYKGLYTTETRKKMVQELELELEKLIERDETVCTVTRAPMVYLMAKAQICAPQVWDAQYLARGYTSAEPLLSYFQAVGKVPDILVATSDSVPDFMDNKAYEIHELIDVMYQLYYEGEFEGIEIYLWRRKEGDIHPSNNWGYHSQSTTESWRRRYIFLKIRF